MKAMLVFSCVFGLIAAPTTLLQAQSTQCVSNSDATPELTVLNLESFPSEADQAYDLLDQITSSHADIVCVQEISADTASNLHTALQDTYSHFTYFSCTDMPADAHRARGVFIASKYSLKNRLRVTPIKSRDSDNDKAGGSCRAGVRGSWGGENGPKWEFRERKQFSPLQLPERADGLSIEMLEIVPVRREGRDSDDRGRGYVGGRVDVEFGPGGSEWSASAFGGYEDDRGNYAEVEVRRNEDGKTSAGAEAGHDKNK